MNVISLKNSNLGKIAFKRRSSGYSKTHMIMETYKVSTGEDNEGRKQVNEYTLIKTLGKGSFGKVKLALKNTTNELYAVKILKKSLLKRKRNFIKDPNGKIKIKTAMEDVKKEIAIMKKLNHPGIVKLHEVIDDPDGDIIFLSDYIKKSTLGIMTHFWFPYKVLEYAEKGELLLWDSQERRFHLKWESEKNYLPENEIRVIMRDLVKALYYLHNNDVIHRDIKPQNVLFDSEGRAKLADFGLSMLIEEGNDWEVSNVEGTYHFMAPEMCSQEDKEKGFSGRSADVWSLGVLLYVLTFLKVPFDGESNIEIMEKIEKSELSFPSEHQISPELEDLITSILKKNWQQRFSLEEIIEHKWINDKKPKLSSELNIFKVQITKDEIEKAFLSVGTIVFLKSFVKKWKRSHSISSDSETITPGPSPKNSVGVCNSTKKSPFSQYINRPLESSENFHSDSKAKGLELSPSTVSPRRGQLRKSPTNKRSPRKSPPKLSPTGQSPLRKLLKKSSTEESIHQKKSCINLTLISLSEKEKEEALVESEPTELL